MRGAGGLVRNDGRMSRPVLPVRVDVGYDLDEKSELEAFLDFHRATVHHKVADLSEEQARRRFVPSLTTAAGIVKHLTCVEHYWFRTIMARTWSRRRVGTMATSTSSGS